MSNERNPHPTLRPQPMGVNGLPDDYIDDIDRDDATGGSRDDREPQPVDQDDIGPDVSTMQPATDHSGRADTVVKGEERDVKSEK